MMILTHMFKTFRALYRNRLPRESRAAIPVGLSRLSGKSHHPKTKQELRQALQKLKALRCAQRRRVEGNVQSKNAA